MCIALGQQGAPSPHPRARSLGTGFQTTALGRVLRGVGPQVGGSRGLQSPASHWGPNPLWASAFCTVCPSAANLWGLLEGLSPARSWALGPGFLGAASG